MIRRLVCAVAIAAIWIALLGWAAGLRWDTPLWPRESLQLPARDFRVVLGAGVEDGEALRIGAVGDNGNAVQAHALGHLRAEDYSFLRYRFDGFPRTLELSLIIRRANGAEEAITVPWPGAGWRTLDLRRVSAWHGEIVELAFAEYATAQLVPPSIAFRPFRFDRAELRSASWRDGLAALGTAWFGYVPWALISVSALVPDRDTSGTASPLPVLALGMVFCLGALGFALRLPRVARLPAAGVGILVLWAALDLRWLADFRGRHALTEDVYAGKTWNEAQRLVPDEDLAYVAERTQQWLAGQPSAQRVLVDSDAKYTYLRLLYLLLPHNVDSLRLVWGATLPEGCLILLYAKTHNYDAERGVLTANGWHFPVEPVFDEGGARLFRVRSSNP